MRKIIRYASISWKATDWQKNIAWVDRDLEPQWEWRGVKSKKTEGYPSPIEDSHIMFALEAKQAGSEITITPMERETEPQRIKINKGFEVYVGNGFLYWETDNEAK